MGPSHVRGMIRAITRRTIINEGRGWEKGEGRGSSTDENWGGGGGGSYDAVSAADADDA